MIDKKIRLGQLKKQYLKYERKKRKKTFERQSNWLDCSLPCLQGYARNEPIGKALKAIAFRHWL